MNGSQIKALRAELDLTQAELGALLGTHQITISKWERGKTAPSPFGQGLLSLLGQVAALPRPLSLSRALASRGAIGALRLVFEWTAPDGGQR